MNKCQTCLADLADGHKFCPECGEKVADNSLSQGAADSNISDKSALAPVAPVSFCSSCGLPLEPNALFCADCGKSAVQTGKILEDTKEKDASVAGGVLASLTGAGCGCGCALPAVLISLLLIFGIIGAFL